MGKKRSGKPAADRHASGKLVRLPEAVHAALRALADENDRPLTRELVRAIAAHLKAHGKPVPEGE